MDKKNLSLALLFKSMIFQSPTESSLSKTSKKSSSGEEKPVKKTEEYHKPEASVGSKSSTTATTATTITTTITTKNNSTTNTTTNTTTTRTVGRRTSRRTPKSKCTPASGASSVTFAYGASKTLPLKRKRAPFQCIICMSDYTNNIPHNTDKCQHSMCRECVRKYFSNLLEKPMKRCDMIACPQPGCKESFMTDKVLYNFFSKSEIKNWWKKAIVQTHIENRVSYYIYKVDDQLGF